MNRSAEEILAKNARSPHLNDYWILQHAASNSDLKVNVFFRFGCVTSMPAPLLARHASNPHWAAAGCSGSWLLLLLCVPLTSLPRSTLLHKAKERNFMDSVRVKVKSYCIPPPFPHLHTNWAFSDRRTARRRLRMRHHATRLWYASRSGQRHGVQKHMTLHCPSAWTP
jgi:hypothetical protein